MCRLAEKCPYAHNVKEFDGEYMPKCIIFYFLIKISFINFIVWVSYFKNDSKINRPFSS